jgi:hypothetical protein
MKPWVTTPPRARAVLRVNIRVRTGEPALVVGGVGRAPDAPLAPIGPATHRPGLIAHAPQRRQQNRHEQGNDGNHHQQLDQRKGFSASHLTGLAVSNP